MANEAEKFGLPQVVIDFKTKSVSAIARSARGIGVMILNNETTNTSNFYKINDVTDIPDVKMNDEVTVFGPENAAIGADTVDSIAAKTGTINYEIICGISRRVPRVYLRDGAPVRIWNDLEEI